MKINQKKLVEVDAKVLRIHIKTCDRFSAQLVDTENEVLKDYEGYVPGFMPGEHYGDYLILDIDIDNGVILNWNRPTPQEIEDFINPEE